MKGRGLGAFGARGATLSWGGGGGTCLHCFSRSARRSRMSADTWMVSRVGVGDGSLGGEGDSFCRLARIASRARRAAEAFRANGVGLRGGVLAGLGASFAGFSRAERRV